ncbi:Arc family DNA-binding protein [Mesorhizobium sp. M0870]|uniref:Arc family DNA-binding protein n=1 Tax=Mesorhizobium sp. M0870 TaxID=2957016 RepID=UPI0033383F5E
MDDTTEARITLRLPTVLRDKLLKAAEESNRSMNGEIVFRLDEFDRLVGEIVQMANSLEKREEALFGERSNVRALTAERQTLDMKVRTAEAQVLLAKSAEVEAEFKLREAQNELVAMRQMLDSADRTIKSLTEATSVLASDSTVVEGIAQRVAEILIEKGLPRV